MTQTNDTEYPTGKGVFKGLKTYKLSLNIIMHFKIIYHHSAYHLQSTVILLGLTLPGCVCSWRRGRSRQEAQGGATGGGPEAPHRARHHREADGSGAEGRVQAVRCPHHRHQETGTDRCAESQTSPLARETWLSLCCKHKFFMQRKYLWQNR